MKLRELAFTRSGDKGNTSNVAVFPYVEEDWLLLLDRVTTDAVRELFGPLIKGTITRFEWPGLKGLNFVMTQALEGGVSNSLLVDPHGKCYQSLMLDLEIGER